MPVEDFGQVGQRHVGHARTVLVLDLVEKLHEFRPLDFVDLLAD
jgi:hypothetical protein